MLLFRYVVYSYVDNYVCLEFFVSLFGELVFL